MAGRKMEKEGKREKEVGEMEKGGDGNRVEGEMERGGGNEEVCRCFFFTSK